MFNAVNDFFRNEMCSQSNLWNMPAISQRLFIPVNNKMLLLGDICESLVMCTDWMCVTKQIYLEPTQPCKFLHTH